MSKILAIYKISPKDQEKINEIIEDLKKINCAELKDYKIEEIGFGIKILKVAFVLNKEKTTDELENYISNIENIENFNLEKSTIVQL